MYTLETGDSVRLLRFFPDGRRLLAGVVSATNGMSLDVVTLPGGERVRLPPRALRLEAWDHAGYGSPVAVHPSGASCYVAWAGRLYAFHTADGTPRPVPEDVKAHQVALSPGGDRLLTAEVKAYAEVRQYLTALAVNDAGDAVVWKRGRPPQRHRLMLAGFLPDGERFVTVDDVVRVWDYATGEEVLTGRHTPAGTEQAQVSPDGRHLGMVGYSSMYLFDLAALGKPRRISSSGNFGNFVSFAFHPDGRTLAVIHGGPTLVKLYDVETLRLTRKYNWKLGPLGAVTFSPDGLLGAAGSRDGRIVVWDVDE
jgi:hypothetical protein